MDQEVTRSGREIERNDWESRRRCPERFPSAALANFVLTLNTQNVDGTFTHGKGAVGAFGGVPGFTGAYAPKLRGFFSTSYNLDPVTVTATLKYTVAGVYSRQFAECTTGCPVSTALRPTILAADNHIAGQTILDLAFTYKPFSEQDIDTFFTIENVTNAPPPEIGGSVAAGSIAGAGNKAYDVLGRQYRAGIRFKF